MVSAAVWLAATLAVCIKRCISDAVGPLRPKAECSTSTQHNSTQQLHHACDAKAARAAATFATVGRQREVAAAHDAHRAALAGGMRRRTAVAPCCALDSAPPRTSLVCVLRLACFWVCRIRRASMGQCKAPNSRRLPRSGRPRQGHAGRAGMPRDGSRSARTRPSRRGGSRRPSPARPSRTARSRLRPRLAHVRAHRGRARCAVRMRL
jgi:hypothetical protein